MVRSKCSKPVVDRISNLPEPLISHILSFLPTKCAVATSVLSTRWKFLWTSITNLDFCSPDYAPQIRLTLLFQWERDKFTHFVNRVLHLLNPPSVHNFSLKLYQDSFDPSCLNSWISAGFERTFNEFELSLVMRDRVELPLNHVDCNVVVLKLDGDINFNIPASASVCFPSLQVLHLRRIKSIIDSNASVSFPNLKRMHLSCVEFVNDGSVHKLFSSCPVLDDLIIERRGGYDDVGCLIICIPSLTRLSIECMTDYYDTMYELQIDSPSLQYLNLIGGLYRVNIPTGNLSSVLHANVKVTFLDDFYEDNVSVESSISVTKFIGSLYNVMFLSVSKDVVKAFRTASVNSSPGFHNLTRLEITFADCLDFSIIISNFLENMDNLEHLDIWGVGCSCSSQSRWTEPLKVPKCLLSRFTTLSFGYARDACCDQLELLRYFLENAEVLQVLTISAPISAEKPVEMIKKISLVRRVSEICQVAFI